MEFFRVFLKRPVYEKIFLYFLNPNEANNIDPDIKNYFIDKAEEVSVMETSQYYVVQIQRDNLTNNELLDTAVELQKEALWSRLKLENKLYLRKITEDNSSKVQLWRPIIVRNQLKF